MLKISITPEGDCYKTQIGESGDYTAMVSVEKWRLMMDCTIEEYRDMCRNLIECERRLIEKPRQ